MRKDVQLIYWGEILMIAESIVNNESWEVSQSYSSQDDSIMEEERKGTQLEVELSVFIICLVGW